MCRFMSMQWYDVLRAYDFALRLDEDVNMTAIPDVFRGMREVGRGLRPSRYCHRYHRLLPLLPSTSFKGARALCVVPTVRSLLPLLRLLPPLLVKGMREVSRRSPHPAARAQHNAVYGYTMVAIEMHSPTVFTFPHFRVAYRTSRDVAPQPGSVLARYKQANPEHREAMFFTNVFVSSPKWWRDTAQVQQYMNAVDRTGAFYSHRWGDAPVQTEAINLFAPASRVIFFPANYTHGSTNNSISHGGDRRRPWNLRTHWFAH